MHITPEAQLEQQREENPEGEERHRKKPEPLRLDKPGENGHDTDSNDEWDKTAQGLTKRRVHDRPDHTGERGA